MRDEKYTFSTSYGADDVGLRQYMTAVYGWMAIGICITGLVALFTVSTPALLRLVYSSDFTIIGLLVAEVILVMYLASRIQKMRFQTAIAVFLGYAALNGLTISSIFFRFTHSSIAGTFFVTAATFGVMTAYGFFTKKDLSSLGNLFFMGLIGIIIASVANFFLQSQVIYWAVTYIGVAIFIGLIAYDTQKIKKYYVVSGGYNTSDGKKLAILGALHLYIDFINLFLLLLRIFGRRK